VVTISAHRGGGEVAAPGTWAAYEHAVAIGVDYVEFDVQRTRDGHLVAYHDSRAERRGHYPRHVNRADLDAFTVEDLMNLIRGRVRAHIDVKEPGFEPEIVGMARTILGDGFVISGSDDVVAAVKATDPAVWAALSLGRGWHEVRWSRTFQMRWSELRPLARVQACGADAVAVHHRLARIGVLDQCRRAGIGTMVWTVNDPRLIRTLLADPRVDVLITEKPGLAARIRPAARS
jgi:glycerophosphoryl diester phosphodiesterase